MNNGDKDEPITGIMFDKFPRSERTYVVMVTTQRYSKLNQLSLPCYLNIQCYLVFDLFFQPFVSVHWGGFVDRTAVISTFAQPI